MIIGEMTAQLSHFVNKFRLHITTVGIMMAYNLLLSIVRILISRLKVSFTAVAIHSFHNDRFKLDFRLQMSQIPKLPFVSIRLSSMQLRNCVTGAPIASVQLDEPIWLSADEVSIDGAQCTSLDPLEFERFASQLLTEPFAEFSLYGHVHLFLMDMVPLLLPSIGENGRIVLDKRVSISALDNLQNFQINSLDVEDGVDDLLMLTCSVAIYNSSIIALDMSPPLPDDVDKIKDQLIGSPNTLPSSGSLNCESEEFLSAYGDLEGMVRLEMFYQDTSVGHAEIKDFYLNSHEATSFDKVKVFLRQNDRISEILSKYMSHEPLHFDIRGTEQSTTIPLLQKPIARLKMSTMLPTLEHELLSVAYLSLLKTNPITLSTWSYLDIYNPFAAVIYIYGIEGSVTMGRTQQVIGEINHYTATDPIILTPKIVNRTKKLRLMLKLNMSSVNALMQMALSQQLKVEVDCKIKCVIGDGFEADVHYRQPSVKVIIS